MVCRTIANVFVLLSFFFFFFCSIQENRGLGTEETEEERVLMSQLNSVEKYALRFLEAQHDFEDLKQAEVIGFGHFL